MFLSATPMLNGKWAETVNTHKGKWRMISIQPTPGEIRHQLVAEPSTPPSTQHTGSDHSADSSIPMKHPKARTKIGKHMIAPRMTTSAMHMLNDQIGNRVLCG
jgi:hypothetical protein